MKSVGGCPCFGFPNKDQPSLWRSQRKRTCTFVEIRFCRSSRGLGLGCRASDGCSKAEPKKSAALQGSLDGQNKGQMIDWAVVVEEEEMAPYGKPSKLAPAAGSATADACRRYDAAARLALNSFVCVAIRVRMLATRQSEILEGRAETKNHCCRKAGPLWTFVAVSIN